MSKQVIAAVFEHGMFRPLTEMTPTISEGQQVRLVVEPMPEVLELATRVHEGLSDLEIAEIEAVALDRRGFFGTRATERPHAPDGCSIR